MFFNLGRFFPWEISRKSSLLQEKEEDKNHTNAGSNMSNAINQNGTGLEQQVSVHPTWNLETIPQNQTPHGTLPRISQRKKKGCTIPIFLFFFP